MRIQLAVALFITMSGVAIAETYGNARFGYFIDIPAAFTLADPEPENGDGRIFHTADKSADLTVSGGWIIEENFAAEVAQNKEFATDAGWKITYESKPDKSSASYSGQKDKRIFYLRMITSCAGEANASYRLEYPAAQKAKYDGVIKMLNASLKPGTGSCG